jgi:hypothetical protein
MKVVLRNLAAVCVGMIVAFLLLAGIELLSAVVHPLPADFGGTQAEMCQHVASCRRRTKNVAPEQDRRGGRIAERTFVQTL